MACKPGTGHFIASQIIPVILGHGKSDFNPSSHHVYSLWRLNTYIYIWILTESPFLEMKYKNRASSCRNAYKMRDPSPLIPKSIPIGEDGLIW